VEYMSHPSINCRVLFKQEMPWALALALLRAGKSIAAKMAMIAITTSNSMRVKPGRWVALRVFERVRISGFGWADVYDDNVGHTTISMAC
jgi:hypothetical protein